MNRRARLEAAVAGGIADRVPVSAWGHFFDRETSAAGLADVMVEFFEAYDWDFLKVHARASYHVEGFGFAYEPSRDPAKGHRCTSQPIHSAADWRALRPLPLDAAPLAEQVDAIRLIRARVPRDVPVIMTVFSPLDIADKLVDRDSALLGRHIAEDPAAVEQALGVFAETFVPFVAQLGALGVDGIYFSTKWANRHKLPAADYMRLAGRHDRAMLDAARGLWCNILHLCEDAIHLDAFADYPVQVIHWDAHTPENPGFDAARTRVRQALGGGVDARLLAGGTPEQVFARARQSIAAAGGRGFLLGPGCSVQVAQTSAANLRALRAAAEAD